MSTLHRTIAVVAFAASMTRAAAADIEVIDTVEGDFECQTVTFEGNGDNAPIGSIPGTPITFASNWRTITSGPYANNPSVPTIAIFGGGSTAEVSFSQSVSNVSLFFSSATPVKIIAYDAANNLIGSATGAANPQPDGFTKWDFLSVAASSNVIARVVVNGGSFSTGVDDFKVCVLTDPVTLIENLIINVGLLNLANGINNSLDAKLDAALNALDDLNDDNDVAACNALEAFINHVQAQAGNQISDEDADYLIEQAETILVLLDCP